MIDILLDKVGSYDLVNHILSYKSNSANLIKKLTFMSPDFIKLCEAHENMCMSLEQLEIQLINIENDILVLSENGNQTLCNHLQKQLDCIRTQKIKMEKKENFDYKCIILYGKLFKEINKIHHNDTK